MSDKLQMEMSGELHSPAASPLGKKCTIPFEQEVGFVPEMFLERWEEKSCCFCYSMNLG
jgi:hypothetical protein